MIRERKGDFELAVEGGFLPAGTLLDSTLRVATTLAESKGYVAVRVHRNALGQHCAYLSPTLARQVALDLMDAADEAEHDANPDGVVDVDPFEQAIAELSLNEQQQLAHESYL